MDPTGCGLLLGAEVYAVIGAAIEVSNELGAGFLEAVYQEAFARELNSRAIVHEEQKVIRIRYKGVELRKHYVADFLCYNKIIVEIKALKQLTTFEEAQVLNYLKATGYPVALLINFGSPKLEWKRYANTTIRVHPRPTTSLNPPNPSL
ncbi:MAG: GxxExxY protein [Chitinivibrionales bacterium]|nr:GxxExxY protein [Chitinivibrionales bacterium]MBD3358406.1 GxxExxY protein [Chitinivibrionales bacterium]